MSDDTHRIIANYCAAFNRQDADAMLALPSGSGSINLIRTEFAENAPGSEVLAQIARSTAKDGMSTTSGTEVEKAPSLS